MGNLKESQLNIKQFMNQIPTDVIPLLPDLDVVVDSEEIKVSLCREGDFKEIGEVIDALSQLIVYLKPKEVNVKVNKVPNYLVCNGGMFNYKDLQDGDTIQVSFIVPDTIKLAKGDYICPNANKDFKLLIIGIDFKRESNSLNSHILLLFLRYKVKEGAPKIFPKEYFISCTRFFKC